ncbi:subtilisin-like protein [Neolentinus lepideus HHB14362 ss-1]|uniref:tripeptidyl-peptidase II n=1 Tax=Neolentinus lepideus HHB14362 ss-1 TaxID=1314782 RepID=A0A165RNV3_9AGAM|nr:subtilisin-like protein [Neolentinus lepideus HHB14362 ss-1]
MLSLLVVVACCLAAYTSPVSQRDWDVTVKHSWVTIPNGWIDVGAPPADHIINLKIGLKQHGFEDLLAMLHEISDPFHPKYGQHLSKREVDDLVAPHESTHATVREWLYGHGIDLASIHYSPAKDWLSLDVPLSTAESLLSASYRSYQHSSTGEQVVRTLSYSLPRDLHAHIDLVHPTTMFDRMKAMRATYMLDATLSPVGEANGATVKGPAGQDIPLSCNTTVTPACLQVLYSTEGYVPQAAEKGNKIGVAGYLEQYVSFADLQTFFTQFRPDAMGTNVTVVSVDGGLNDQSLPGIEADLNVQYTEGLTYPTPNYYYSTPGTAPTINDSVTPPQRDEPYLDWLTYMLGLPDGEVPQAFTTSYGGDEQTFPYEWAVRVCGMFAQLSARGSSVMFSSGDGGVGAGTCQTNDGTNRTLFQPVFPATCPYITGVGATYQIAPEKGVYFSQGGFSRYFKRPLWQAAAVPPFLEKLGSTYAGLYNPAGRAVPDVSAQGYGFQVVVEGKVESVGGTSASSPTFASIVSLLNDYRLANGRPSLGWLNPLLYTTGLSGFTDILLGNNPGCGTLGFNATEGWDAITGLGTPDFVKLKELLGFI